MIFIVIGVPPGHKGRIGHPEHTHTHTSSDRPRAVPVSLPHHLPDLATLFWLIAFPPMLHHVDRCGLQPRRDASVFADTNIAEDWHLASPVARRGSFICLGEPVPVYHRRHPVAARNGPEQVNARQDVCSDCLSDPSATPRSGCSHPSLGIPLDQRPGSAPFGKDGRAAAATDRQPSTPEFTEFSALPVAFRAECRVAAAQVCGDLR